MENFVEQLSIHAPAISDGWSFLKALFIAAVAGFSLSAYCRIAYGQFGLWGFIVGVFGVLFLWLVLAVLAVKWALILVAVVGLPIATMFYIDEQSLLTSQELERAAAGRHAEFQRLFEDDPEAAESITETLNLGLEDPSGDWPKGSLFAGIPRRVVRNATIFIVVGYFVIGVSAFLLYRSSISGNTTTISDEIETGKFQTDRAKQVSKFEAPCIEITGIEFELCLTKGLEQAEAELSSLHERAILVGEIEAESAGFPTEVISSDAIRQSMTLAQQEWLEYRESTCDLARYPASHGSGTGGFIQTCRLRMTVDRVNDLRNYGSSFPDYQPVEVGEGD